MPDLYPENIKRVTAALLKGEAVLKPEHRQAIEARAARHAGAVRTAMDVPADLAAYVDKVALHAYKVTDEDIITLKEAGYTEDELFEATLCAALGASLARMEQTMNLLKGV